MVSLAYIDRNAEPRVPACNPVMAAFETGDREPHLRGPSVAVHEAVLGDAVGPQEPEHGLGRVAAGKTEDAAAFDHDLSVQIAPAETRPVDQRQKGRERKLRLAHASGQDMRVAVR